MSDLAQMFEDFLYPATLKSAGYYVILSVQKFASECPSVRLSVFTDVYLCVSFPINYKVPLCVNFATHKGTL